MRLVFAASLGALVLGAGSGGAVAWAAPSSWSAPVPIAAHPPVAEYGILGGVSCPSAQLCVATDNFGNVLTSAAPTTAAWSRASLVGAHVLTKPQGIFPSWLFGVSCPSPQFCVALDVRGQIVSSVNPSGGAGAWKVVSPGHLLGSGEGQVACPSVHLCVSVNGVVASSTDPAGGAGAWKVTRVGGSRIGAPISVSCPSRHLCVGVSRQGGVFVSADPTGGRGAWRSWLVEHPRAPNYGLAAVSCPSTRLCVAAGGGRVAISRHPAAGPKAWRTIRVPFYASSLACPSTRLCVAGVYGGVEVSTRPTRGRKAWVFVPAGAPGVSINAVACPSSRLCVAAGDHGELLSSTTPARRRGWSFSAADGENPLAAVSCPAVTECVTVGDAGGDAFGQPGVPSVVASTNPTGGPTAWSQSHQVGGSAISCPSLSLCVAGDTTGHILTSTDPTGPPSRWSRAAVVAPEQQCENEHCMDIYASIDKLSCPASTFCAGIAVNGPTGHWYYLSSTDPTGGAGAWNLDDKLTFDPHGLSCPSVSLCVSVGGEVIATSTTPTDGASFTPKALDTAANAALLDVSCPSSGLCVAVDSQGNVLSSTTPTDPGSWTTSSVDPGHPLHGITCASANLCLAFDDQGDAAISTHPASPTSWSLTTVDPGFDVYGNPLQIAATACPSEQLCVLVDGAGRAITGTA